MQDMGFILNYLRTAPAPTYNPSRPLLPDAPPASSLPLNPVAYLTLAIDSLAPLMKIRNMKGIAGGGAALPVPSALPMRQRRRQAFTWILDSVEKKQSKGSGKKMFAHRVAEEIVAVVEGKSSCWEKRHAAHKAATTSRANLSTVSKMRQKKGNMKGPYSN
jgi:small subunit ribosomal protein S7